jgi:predicted acetyltransferase
MRLVTPSGAWQSAFLDMAREYESAGDRRYSSAIRDFDAYLRNVEAGVRGEGLPEGRVPATEFWLEHDGTIIGCARLRLGLTPDLENEGGHVGYDVRPSRRRRGYGTVLLRFALIEARALGIERVRITCDDDNLGSIRVIERNGGVLAGRGVSKKTGKTVLQYWVRTSPAPGTGSSGGPEH